MTAFFLPIAKADDLGRLFYTPQERQSLESMRGVKQQAAVLRPSSEPQTMLAVPQKLTLKGLVSRDSRSAEVWAESNSSRQLPPPLAVDKKTAVTPPSNDDKPQVVIKPGQTWHSNSNKVNELFERETLKNEASPKKLLEIKRNHAQP
jgi:hypothetical protein